MNFLYSMVAFCVTISIVVTVHELGHYLTARWCGVAVETFAIGFGRPVATWYDRAGTAWQIGWLPLGGYVKMGQLESHKLLSRILVVIAGPIANVLLAMLIITSAFVIIGTPVSTPIIGYVAPDSPAAHAGLMPRDRVVTFDNIPVASFEKLRTIIAERAGKTVPLTVERGGAQEQLQATLSNGVLGIMPANERMGLPRALVMGPVVTVALLKAMTVGLLHISTAEVSGPVGIAQASGEAAHLGLMTWLWLVTSLSISLAVLNMIPLPILDGGRLVYYLIEAILGHPLSRRIQSVGLVTSSLLLLGVFAFVTWRDISRWLFG